MLWGWFFFLTVNDSWTENLVWLTHYSDSLLAAGDQISHFTSNTSAHPRLPANIHRTEESFAVLRDFTEGTAAREPGQRPWTSLETLCLSRRTWTRCLISRKGPLKAALTTTSTTLHTLQVRSSFFFSTFWTMCTKFHWEHVAESDCEVCSTGSIVSLAL